MHLTVQHTRLFRMVYNFLSCFNRSATSFEYSINSFDKATVFLSSALFSNHSLANSNCGFFSILKRMIASMKLNKSSFLTIVQEYNGLFVKCFLVLITPLKYLAYNSNVCLLEIDTITTNRCFSLPESFKDILIHPSPSECPDRYALIFSGICLWYSDNSGYACIPILFALVFTALLVLFTSNAILSKSSDVLISFNNSVCSFVQLYMVSFFTRVQKNTQTMQYQKIILNLFNFKSVSVSLTSHPHLSVMNGFHAPLL